MVVISKARKLHFFWEQAITREGDIRFPHTHMVPFMPIFLLPDDFLEGTVTEAVWTEWADFD